MMRIPYYLLGFVLILYACKNKTPEPPVVLECDFMEAIAPKQNHDNINCGYLQVPENHTNPKGRKINIAYVVLKAKNKDTVGYPMVYFSGGPGGRAIDVRAVRGWSNTPLNQNHDIILFDQRGIHYSSALPDIGMSLFEAMAENVDHTQETVLFAKVLDKYKEQCTAQGIDLASYNSFENAKDVGALMQYLGYEKYNLYGGSYGTRLARIVQDLFPEKIHSVILDAPAPLQGDFLISRLQSYSLALQRIFDFCENDPECNTQYPNLKTHYIESITSFKNDPMKVVVEDTPFYVNAQDAVYFLRRHLYDNNSKTKVPAFIKALSERDASALEQAVANEKNGIVGFLNTSMLLSVECYEQFNAKNTPEVIEEMYQSLPLLPAKLGFFTALYEAGQDWHDKRLPDDDKNFTPSDIPTLIFVNQYDPVTPPRYGHHFKEKLSNAKLFILDQGGHGATFTPCGMQIIMDFMHTPNIETLDSSCLNLYED